MLLHYSEKYERLKREYNNIVKAVERAEKKLENKERLLNAEKGKIVIECDCGTKTPINKIELINECYSSSRECGSDNYNYYYRKFWVCSGCLTLIEPINDKDIFNDDFDKYVKDIHEWDSEHSRRVTGRVGEILGPYFKKQEELRAKKEKEWKIQNAKRILKEAGEL